MQPFDWGKRKVTDLLVRYLTANVGTYEAFAISDPVHLLSILQVGDVLLVEGKQRFSTAVKYLTQSTWSHAAIYVGHVDSSLEPDSNTPTIVEADLANGVIAVPLSKYAGFNTRICRPVGLADSDRKNIAQFMFDSLGMSYDLKNIVDLARYLIPTPPVPRRWRRRMLAIGSGDPTRVICSTRIAEAFQSIGYPILPRVEQQILHIRHHSLFTPRDFDVSPYFEIVKPTLARGFDFKQLQWGQTADSVSRPQAPTNPSRNTSRKDTPLFCRPRQI